ncbi:DUF484 family protein [Celeribacter indicus]|uniref:Recombinase XerC n=1 Tax=Celeribacter indicus TaxID=1208324 RepID=A0A0B5E0A4_9RHOB|nr:DUF484 family protein [Celeribacter indicus]AJE45892.1 hypothetical protein P73_1177 [Celeribacter indicus]SDW63142.1 hypothetical protein SAMN05443573_105124 [Celeribacter indicus]
MSTQFPRAIPSMADELREKIISAPEMILDDQDVMRALIAADERASGTNVVDLRGIAMERLEERLDRLEDTHRGVIAAAYENLAGTNQVHRAVLKLLEPANFTAFLATLSGEVAEILRVDAVRLLLETKVEAEDPAVKRLGEVLVTAEPGFADGYVTLGRNLPVRPVTLRQISPDGGMIYGAQADFMRSEAVMKLDLGPGRLPGLLILGAEDPHLFRPSQGTDLLVFFAGVFERLMRRWLG